jgi:4-diphosphocytidyl-2-C-methyl-D-erythritol kinase
MTSIQAPAKINLALAVGPVRPDGLHEVATLLQRIELADTLSLEPADALAVEGFPDDTLVCAALTAVAAAAGAEPRWRARLDKRIPVAAGLGGGSSDAAAAIRLACGLLDDPPPAADQRRIAEALGVDVAFFLEDGPQLGTGTGTTLELADLPQDYAILLLLPVGARKPSTAEVYARFDREAGFEERRARVLAVAAAGRGADLASLPANDLAGSPHAARLLELGAFRADVTGAGPTVYGLFAERDDAERAAARIEGVGEVWVTTPAW